MKKQHHWWEGVRDDGETWLAHCGQEPTAVRTFFWRRQHGNVIIFPPRDENADRRWFVVRPGWALQWFPSEYAAFYFGS